MGIVLSSGEHPCSSLCKPVGNIVQRGLRGRGGGPFGTGARWRSFGCVRRAPSCAASPAPPCAPPATCRWRALIRWAYCVPVTAAQDLVPLPEDPLTEVAAAVLGAGHHVVLDLLDVVRHHGG